MTSAPSSLRLISWNMHRMENNWALLADDRTLDIALLQEAPKIGADRMPATAPDAAGEWRTGGRDPGWCAAVARCSDRFPVSFYPMAQLDVAGAEHLGVSRTGTIAAARVQLPCESLLVVSAYASWDYFHPEVARNRWKIQADSSAHRVISDLCALLDSEEPRAVICAGDWNLMFDYEGGSYSSYWARRDKSVFDRMDAIGIPMVGPRSPNGRQADPWPAELPAHSLNVPTYRTVQGNVTRQLDYVFATRDLHERLTVIAHNEPESWGPSDHCQIRIELGL